VKTFVASPEHAAAVARLFDMYRVFYEQTSDLHAAQAFIDTRLARGDSHIICCELEGDIVGFTQLYPSFSSVRMRPIWILNDLFVDPAARRRGVAQTLMRAAGRHAFDTGAAYLTLETHRDNTSAQAVYLAEGWSRDEEHFHFSVDAPSG
jgi:GNAT superfamily N-acetyltransferase